MQNLNVESQLLKNGLFGSANIGGVYDIVVKRADGSVKTKFENNELKCYCPAFHAMIINTLSQGAYVNAWEGQGVGLFPFSVNTNDINSVSSKISAADTHYNHAQDLGAIFTGTGIEGDLTSGIVVGTGTTASTNATHSIETIVPHGLEDASLYYYSSIVYSPIYNGNQEIIVATRSAENKGTTDINLTEIALYGKNNQASPHTFCLMRDVFAEAITVSAGELVTVVYKQMFNSA